MLLCVVSRIRQAEELFEAAIAANPVHAESLGNLAVLLHGQPDNEPAVLDRIEGLYKRAVHADPANANNFSNYGLFLAEVTLISSVHTYQTKCWRSCRRLRRRRSKLGPAGFAALGHVGSVLRYWVYLVPTCQGTG